MASSKLVHPTCTISSSSSSFVPRLRSSGTAAARLFLKRDVGAARRWNTVRSSRNSCSPGNKWEDWWKKRQPPPSEKLNVPCLSDILWPSAGAFAAMALLGKLDQMVAPRGLSFTIAPLGAVCAVLFTAPNSPAAQIAVYICLNCALGEFAAASLPILFIDGAKFHSLNLWYAFFPGATGCLILCLIQEVVTYLKVNCRF